MIDTNIEIIHEDEEIIVYRISWYAFGEHGEKIITEHKERPP